MIRHLLLLAVAVASATACLPLGARSLVDIDLVDRDSGRVLPEYARYGRIHVPGDPGHRYSVRLRNQSGERVLVVLSVDGVNAVSGETASPSQAGYVLEPWETADIAGWRKSLSDIAQFYFTDLPDSYAARTGRPDNVGVVGIAVFREQVRYRHYPTPTPLPPPPIANQGGYDRAEAEAAAPQASRSAADASSNAMRERRLGTGHGEREWAPVGQTQFQRATRRPTQVTELHYDDHDALVAMGIVPRHDWPYDNGRGDEPRAFPNGFVADPPGW